MVGYKRKQRDSRRKKAKRVLLFAAEGKNETERKYLNRLKGDSLIIRYAPGNETDPEQMMKQLIQAYNRYGLSEKDYAACLVDADFSENKNRQLKAADQRANTFGKSNVKLIVSAPCFEIWLLCHFCYTTKQYRSAQEILNELRKYIDSYQKADEISSYLQGKEQMAIKNAKKLERYAMETGKRPHTVDFAPASDVYKIFEEFLQKL